MIKKNIFNSLSIICLILFCLTALLGILVFIMDLLYILKPGCCGLGTFEPLFSYIDIYYYQQPRLYEDQFFRFLTLISDMSLFLLATLILWFLKGLLKNIHTDSLFMYENVSILYNLGITTIVLGSIFTYSEEFLLTKALAALDITNAEITFSALSYIDMIISGIILIIIASALKRAVYAVEENKKTI